MSADHFVDTNVLVYARDSSEIDKQPRALEWLRFLWRERRGTLSFQVLQEYYVTVTRKLVPGLPVSAARADVRSLLAWHPLAVDEEVLEAAWACTDRYGLSWWDSLVVAAAQVAGCSRLLTEDLQDGQRLDGLTVVNPFRQAPPS